MICKSNLLTGYYYYEEDSLLYLCLVSKYFYFHTCIFKIKNKCMSRLLILTHSDTEPRTGYSKTDIINQRHIDTESSRIIKETAEDHLALSRSHGVTLRLHRTDAVRVHHRGTHFTRQAEDIQDTNRSKFSTVYIIHGSINPPALFW